MFIFQSFINLNKIIRLIPGREPVYKNYGVKCPLSHVGNCLFNFFNYKNYRQMTLTWIRRKDITIFIVCIGEVRIWRTLYIRWYLNFRKVRSDLHALDVRFMPNLVILSTCVQWRSRACKRYMHHLIAFLCRLFHL